jgi:hypothetical protein
MAQKVQIELIDDLDGTEAEATVYFGLDGKSYEIDLSHDNSKKLHEALDEWIAAARKAGAHRKAAKGAPRTSSAVTSAVRSWASANGYSINERGRIPQQILAAYQAANPTATG